jgi:hypothetical protein
VKKIKSRKGRGVRAEGRGGLKSHYPGGRTLDGFTAEEYREVAQWCGAHGGLIAWSTGAVSLYFRRALADAVLQCDANRHGLHVRWRAPDFTRMYHWLLARAAFADALERAKNGGGA